MFDSNTVMFKALIRTDAIAGSLDEVWHSWCKRNKRAKFPQLFVCETRKLICPNVSEYMTKISGIP